MLTSRQPPPGGGVQPAELTVHVDVESSASVRILSPPYLSSRYSVIGFGFENISILEIAERIAMKVPSEIIVSESNDPRSYRQNSDKLLATGFINSFSIETAIDEIIMKYNNGDMEDRDEYHTVKTMKNLNLDK